MVKPKNIIFAILVIFFLFFSFYPTIFELKNRNNLTDKSREFILEHNYYWPDYNLYLSKIRQGFEGYLTAQEKYTSERHSGSLIQEFYVILGHLGRFLGLEPNYAYLLGRIVFSTLLLLIILKLVKYYFSFNNQKSVIPSPDVTSGSRNLPTSEYGRSLHAACPERSRGGRDDNWYWPIIAFFIVITSSSFPRFYQDAVGITHIGRFMEWWSNIDALQRISFIPHILFGQVVSFYLLYHLTFNIQHLTIKKYILYIILGNILGFTFPPSLITLNTVILLNILYKAYKYQKCISNTNKSYATCHCEERSLVSLGTSSAISRACELEQVKRLPRLASRARNDKLNYDLLFDVLYLVFSLPSLLYIFLLTKTIPWSALVDFHRTHPMMIPFWEYILGTGPIFFLGLAGAVLSVINRDRKFQPLILWILVTFTFAIFFTHVRDQSPLRFTQTGLFIPLGIFGTYFFYQLFHLSYLSHLGNLGRRLIKTGVLLLIILYTLFSLLMMKVSLDWQTTWISQRLRANIPPVPYPPQAMYPLIDWIDGIRWLKNHTNHNDVVLAEITAGNYIPAYSGNTVYFGQANTVDYERKQLLVDRFLKGEMGQTQAEIFLKEGRVKYIFYSIQEKEMAGGKNLFQLYPLSSFQKPLFANQTVEIFSNDF